MGHITLDKHDAARILVNPESGPDARVIAGMTVAFFEMAEHAEMITPTTATIVRKLAHKITGATYGEKLDG